MSGTYVLPGELGDFSIILAALFTGLWMYLTLKF